VRLKENFLISTTQNFPINLMIYLIKYLFKIGMLLVSAKLMSSINYSDEKPYRTLICKSRAEKNSRRKENGAVKCYRYKGDNLTNEQQS
jgi:hypothetical protein